MPYPMTRENCLDKADECQREADRSESDGDRKIYGRLAEYWRTMARAVRYEGRYPPGKPTSRPRHH